MGQGLKVTVPCSRAHRRGSCLNEMLLRTMRWPHKAVSRTIILQLAEKEQHLIFEKEDFPSECSDDINPLWLKLNLAAVVFLCRIKDWTSHTACSSLSTASCCLLKGRLADFFFSPCYCLQQKGHWAHVTMGMVQVLDTAETLRYKCFNFNQRAPLSSNRPSIQAEWQQGPQLAILQQQCRAAALKRC